MKLDLDKYASYSWKYNNDESIRYFFSFYDYKIYTYEDVIEEYGEDNYNEEIFIPFFSINVDEIEKEYLRANHMEKELKILEESKKYLFYVAFRVMFEDDWIVQKQISKILHDKAVETGIKWCKEHGIKYICRKNR